MTPDSILRDAARLELGGDMLGAYDRVVAGLAEYPQDIDLRHRAVLLLARSGSAAKARQEYARLGLADVADHVEAISLGGRLLKDLAFAASGDERRRYARESASKYAEAFALRGDYYPGVNTATMLLLSGDAPRAADVATSVLEAVARGADEDPGGAYYRAASRAEACFLLGRIDEGERALADAIGRDPGNYTAHASTFRQLDAVFAALRLDRQWLDRYRPPPAMAYCGHMFDDTVSGPPLADLRARIGKAMDEIGPGAVFGSLAAGADILVAEIALARGAELHVVLPVQEEDFIARSVAPFGGGWEARYRSCKDRAATFRLASRDAASLDDTAFAFCSEFAMGLAIRHADALRTRACQLAVWDGRSHGQEAGTAADVKRWAATERPQHIVPYPPRAAPNRAETFPDQPVRRVKTMLFGDVRGFSRLKEADITPFVANILKPLAARLRETGTPADLVATWGDGLHFVYDDVDAAAEVALTMQEAFARLDLAAAALPDHLALRIGGHTGPVTALKDPFLKSPSFYGTHITIAARIEPVAVPGAVYVSEPFAAFLALRGAGRFTTEYVGQTDLPKQFGTMRLFSLRHAEKLQ